MEPGFVICLLFFFFLPLLTQKSSKYNCKRQKIENQSLQHTRHVSSPSLLHQCGFNQRHGDTAFSPLCLSHTFRMYCGRLTILSRWRCRQTVLWSGFHYGGREAVDVPVSCEGSCVKCIYFFLLDSAPGVSLYFDWSRLWAAKLLCLRRWPRPQLQITL